MLLQLKRTWPGGRFQRFSRDKNGKPIEHFKWTSGTVVEVPDAHLECVLNDIGNSLIEVVLDEKGRARPVGAEPVAEKPKKRRRSESLVEA
jgi:hypothetical protein